MKSTQNCIPAKLKNKCTRLLAMLGGLLLLFPLLLTAPALAAPRSAAPPLTKPQQIVDLAGVSVVRLSLEYLTARGSSIFCTTLGTIVASWPAQSADDKNNWVLTDGSLLNQSTQNSCTPGGRLATIKILASNEFTNSQPVSAQLGLLTCTSTGVCDDALDSVTGPPESLLTLVNGTVLFSFHTNLPLPYIDVEKAATTGLPAPTSIELANTNGVPPASPKNGDAPTALQFLGPIANTATPGSAPSTPIAASAPTTEPGMPYIDGNGKITGAQLFNTRVLVTITDIENLEKQLVLPPGQTLSQLLNKNTLSQQWDTGIIQYEHGNNRGAVQTLGSIQNAPPAFQAPAAFKSKAQAKIPTNTGTSTPVTSNGQNNHAAFSFLGIPLLVIVLITGVLILVLLFVRVSITFGSGRFERIEMRSNNNKEKTSSVFIQTQLGRLNNLFNKFKQALQTRAPDSKSLNPQTQHPQRAPSYILCPNCNQAVPNDVAFCPNCRYSLLPDTQNARPVFNNSPAPVQPVVAAPLTRNSIQPRPPVQAPKMQDDPAIQAALQRLWDRAGR